MGGLYVDPDPDDVKLKVATRLTDAEKLKVAAIRTHLRVAANTQELFAERVTRLRNVYLLLAARHGATETSEYAKLCAQLCEKYNRIREMLAASLYPRTVGTLPPTL